jgi:hypothetical protein
VPLVPGDVVVPVLPVLLPGEVVLSPVLPLGEVVVLPLVLPPGEVVVPLPVSLGEVVVPVPLVPPGEVVVPGDVVVLEDPLEVPLLPPLWAEAESARGRVAKLMAKAPAQIVLETLNNLINLLFQLCWVRFR